MDYDVAILGAGPAGLGAAYRAAETGRRVVVVERSERVGGLAGSFEVGGIRVDLGSHRLHPSTDPQILAELRRLLGPRLQLRTRRGRIRLQGRWLAFPLSVKDALLNTPPGFAARAVLDAALGFTRRDEGNDFASVLRARLGPTIADGFYLPYARKLWGVQPETLSAEQARRRVTADSPGKILKRIVAGSGRGGAEGSGTFWYPRGGYGDISEALAAAAVDAGAELRLGSEVTAIDTGERVAVETRSGDRLKTARVWSTLPAAVLAKLARPAPAAEILEAAGRLRSRAMVLVYLVLDVDRYTSFDAHYLPEGWTPVSRISEPKNYRDGDDPPDRTVLCAEIPCDIGDDRWQTGDADLAAVVINTLERAELPAASPAAVNVVRLPHVYPIYDIGYEEAFARVDAWASEQQPQLLTFGRQGLFAHDNAHHALSMAWAAVDALTENGFDQGAWASARTRFAQHVVED